MAFIYGVARGHRLPSSAIRAPDLFRVTDGSVAIGAMQARDPCPLDPASDTVEAGDATGVDGWTSTLFAHGNVGGGSSRSFGLIATWSGADVDAADPAVADLTTEPLTRRCSP